MATYAELIAMRDDALYGQLLNKVREAVIVKAAAIIDSGTPGTTALDWAKNALARPNEVGNDIINYVVAANNTATTSQILNAGDALIYANVSAAVDAIYGA